MSTLRSDLFCPVFGHGRDFSPNVLPTYEDVMRCYLWISRNKPNQFKNLATDTSIEVSEKLSKIWQMSSVPTIQMYSIVRKIKEYHNKYRNLLKTYKLRKNCESYQNRIQNFKDEAKYLFDIAACKCTNFDLCKCEKQFKVPIKEREFLIDQRGNRKMGIGNTDVVISSQNDKAVERKRKYEMWQKNHQLKSNSSNEQHCAHDLSSSIEELEEDITPNCYLKKGKLSISHEITSKLANINKIREMPTIAHTADRYGVSDRAAAAIVSATLKDVGLISKENSSLVVDRNKIRRHREKQRNLLSHRSLIIDDDFGLYFDGRKDKTLLMIDGRRKKVSEEHISLVKEPNSEYLGHISVPNGKAIVVSDKIKDFLDEKQVNCDNLIVVGCDGTAVNTGAKGGIIRCLENKLQRPLQWFICQLHANELTLRHLFEHLDGPTTGPRSFMGPIGKNLNDCETLPLVVFKPIGCCLPDISNHKDLSTDQLYLFEICNSINSGECQDSISKNNPGKIVHSRWLTTANRLLRLYVSTITPTEGFLHLVTFVLKVYAPMWFTIKTKPSCVYGAIHLHKTIALSRYMPDNLKAVIDPVIERNGYFGQAENLLLAMLADDRKDIKILALERILKSKETSNSTVRSFKVPKLNFSAETYIDIINWNAIEITEPPILSKFSAETLTACMQIPDKVDTVILPSLKRYVCHTQATERCVKIVTEASSAVCGPDRRDGIIRTRLLSRKIMPSFETKKDYKVT